MTTTPTYAVGGTVSGLSGSVTLTGNGTDPLTVPADGGFAFGTKRPPAPPTP